MECLSRITVFILMSCPVAGAAAVLARAAFPDRPPGEKLLVSAVLAYAAVVIATAAAGFAGMLAAAPLAAFGFVFLAAAVPASVALKRRARTPAPPRPAPWRSGLSGALSLALVLPALIVVFAWSAAAPPPPWDGFVYHLTFPARWIQERAVHLVTVPFGDQAGTYFPSNTELLYAWLMLPFREEILVTPAQFAFLLLTACAVFRLAVETGAGGAGALGAALLCLTVPEMLHQAAAAEVDLAFAFLFVAAVLFLARCVRENFSTRSLVPASLAFGLLAGTKYIGIPYGLLLVPAFVYAAARSGAPVKRLALSAALALAAGGFWYVRNCIVAGNPVFPLTVSFLGLELFPGAYTREAMLKSVFHVAGPAEFARALRAAAGVPILAALCAYVPLGALAAAKARRWSLTLAFSFLLPLLLLGVWWFAVPYNGEWRFAFPALALATLFAAHAMEGTGAPARLARAALPVAIASALAENRFLAAAARNLWLALSGDPNP
ncbi:MAG: hypothetical protein AB1742_14130, partial [bacterium]